MIEALLYIVPALLLALSLALGRYPGERLRLALGAPAGRRARPVSAPPRRFAPLVLPPRGGALLATSRAGRAPPLARRRARPGAALAIATQGKEFREMRRAAISIVLGCALLAPAAAQAHVTLQPDEAAAGGYTVLDVRVPNETEDANTTKVQVQFPAGFATASYQPVPGWSVQVVKEKLAKPVQTDDGPITEGVREMTWTGHGSQGRIAPGQFMDFPVSVQIPGKPGDELTFKALQTYDDGEIVRWIGAPESEHPAPQVTVTAAAEGSGAAAPAEAGSGSGGASKGLGIAALVVGALGLIAGGAALLRSRPRAA